MPTPAAKTHGQPVECWTASDLTGLLIDLPPMSLRLVDDRGDTFMLSSTEAQKRCSPMLAWIEPIRSATHSSTRQAPNSRIILFQPVMHVSSIFHVQRFDATLVTFSFLDKTYTKVLWTQRTQQLLAQACQDILLTPYERDDNYSYRGLPHVHRSHVWKPREFALLGLGIDRCPSTRELPTQSLSYAPSSSTPLTRVQQLNLVWMRQIEQQPILCDHENVHEPVLASASQPRRVAGGILMDSTGLGKTRTVLELVRMQKHNGQTGPTLILVPPNIVTQWTSQCARWVPDLKVGVLYGAGAKKLDLDDDQLDIVISTPSTFSRLVHSNQPVKFDTLCGAPILTRHVTFGPRLADLGRDSDLPEVILALGTPYPSMLADSPIALESISQQMEHYSRLVSSAQARSNLFREYDFVSFSSLLTPHQADNWPEHSRVWIKLPVEPEYDTCLCRASVQDRYMLQIMIDALEACYINSHSLFAQQGIVDPLNKQYEHKHNQMRSSCACALIDILQPMPVCPCKLRVSTKQLSVRGVYYNRQYLRYWMKHAMSFLVHMYMDDRLEHDFLRMLSHAALMWHKLLVYKEMIYSQHIGTVNIMPRTGLWVVVEHADTREACGLVQPDPRATWAIESWDRCDKIARAQTLCRNSSCCGVVTHSRARILQDYVSYVRQHFPVKLKHWNRIVIDEYHSVGKGIQFASLFYNSAWLVSATIDKSYESLAMIGRCFFGMPFLPLLSNAWMRLDLQYCEQQKLHLLKERMQGSQEQIQTRVEKILVRVPCRPSQASDIRHTEDLIQRVKLVFYQTPEYDKIASQWYNSLLHHLPLDVVQFCRDNRVRSNRWTYILQRAFQEQTNSERAQVQMVDNMARGRTQFKDLMEYAAEGPTFYEPGCSICLDDLEEAVIVPCRHVYCFECIQTWSLVNPRCPKCRVDVQRTNMAFSWKKFSLPTDDTPGQDNQSTGEPASSSLEPSADEPQPLEAGAQSSSSSSATSLAEDDSSVPVKIAWLARFAGERRDEPIVVYVNGSTEFVAHNLRRLGVRAQALTSSMNAMQRGRLIKRLYSGQVHVLCLKYSTHAAGIDLANIRTLVCLTPDASTVNMIQAIGRVRRLGSNHGQSNVYMVAFEESALEREMFNRLVDSTSEGDIQSSDDDRDEPALGINWFEQEEQSLDQIMQQSYSLHVPYAPSVESSSLGNQVHDSLLDVHMNPIAEQVIRSMDVDSQRLVRRMLEEMN